MITVAAVQYPPIYYDLAKGLERAAEIVTQAAGEGIQCLVFPEAWLTGYPLFAWELAPEYEFGDYSAVYKRMYDNSPILSRDDLKLLAKRGVVLMWLGTTPDRTSFSFQ